MSRRAVIEGAGHRVPPKVMTNHDLEAIVDTNDEWIRRRTGIVERRICADDETASTIASQASKHALESASMEADELDLVICGTVTGDMMFPATSCLVQRAIGAKNAGAFDVGAACAGFITSLAVGASMIESGLIRNALVIGVDTLSKLLDWTDRSTCVLFGDGAGAVVLKGDANTDRGLMTTVLLADGEGADYIRLEASGTKHPMCDPRSAAYSSTVYMAGPEVFRFAVTAMGDACCRVLDTAGLTPEDIDLFVPHQANLRIIESAAERLGLPPEKVFVNVHKYGNTSAGSIPIGLSEAVSEGRLKKGMIVMTVGFGAGLVWGANLIRW